MRNRFLSIISAVALVFAVLLVGTPSAQAADTSSIAGTIHLPAGFSFPDPDNPGEVYIGHVMNWGFRFLDSPGLLGDYQP